MEPHYGMFPFLQTSSIAQLFDFLTSKKKLAIHLNMFSVNVFSEQLHPNELHVEFHYLTFVKLMSNSDFSISNQADLGSETKHDPREYNGKTEKYLSRGCRGEFPYTLWGQKVIMLGVANLFKLLFSRMVKYDSLDSKWYKKSDFE